MERESIKVLKELDAMIAELKTTSLLPEEDCIKTCLKRLKEKYS